MTISLNLSEYGDRCVSLIVTDKHGEVYRIGLEFLAHEFGPSEDDVQVSVHKMPKDHELRTPTGVCPIFPPNTILYRDEVLDSRKEGHNIDSHVWFEFHETDGLPPVKS